MIAVPTSLPAVNFARRSDQKEIMDDLQGTGPDWHQALRELKVINRFLGGNKLTLKGIARLLKGSTAAGPVAIADIGCGGGDMLMVIARWARKEGIPVRLFGVDANPHIIKYAEGNTAAYPEIQFMAADIFSEEFRKQKFDIVTCTLFTHHFTNEQLVRMLGQLKEQARLGLVVNDLHRHPLAYYSIKWITALVSKSRMVQHDAPVSVLRAFSRKDWENIMNRAGVKHFRLRWRWAFRWMLLVQGYQIPSGKSKSSSLITG